MTLKDPELNKKLLQHTREVVYWRSKIYLTLLTVSVIILLLLEPVLKQQLYKFFLFLTASVVLSILVCHLLTKVRIFFAETFLLTSVIVRSLGFYLIARSLGPITCVITIKVTTLRYLPVYLFHADVLLFRTNIFSILGSLISYLIFG